MISINVYGPPGSGKTRNAERLRKYFGLDFVIEEPEKQGKVPWINSLVLSQKRQTNMPAIHIDDALKLLRRYL